MKASFINPENEVPFKCMTETILTEIAAAARRHKSNSANRDRTIKRLGREAEKTAFILINSVIRFFTSDKSLPSPHNSPSEKTTMEFEFSEWIADLKT